MQNLPVEINCAPHSRHTQKHVGMLQPAQFFVKKRSSEKLEVLVTVSALDAKSCGAETVPELVTSPHTTLPVDTPPLVAVDAARRSSARRPAAAKLAAVAAPEAVRVPVDTSPTVVKFPALAVAAGDSGDRAQQAHAGRPCDAQRAARHGAGGRQRGSGDGAGGRERCAGDCSRGVHAVVKTSVQFTSLHSSWSQPALPCAVSPSSVAETVSRSVTETDSPSKALALICTLYRSSVPANCCTSPGIDPPKAEVQLRDSARRHREVQACRAADTLRGRAEEGAGDAHVVVVGRADVHHQVGGRAQPVPAAEGVASPV